MTDIWRGIIISGFQNLNGFQTAFGKLGFTQERNEHDLISDFVDEISGHVHNKSIKEIVDSLWSNNSSFDDTYSVFQAIYSKLVSIGILESEEIECVNEFIAHAHSLNS